MNTSNYNLVETPSTVATKAHFMNVHFFHTVVGLALCSLTSLTVWLTLYPMGELITPFFPKSTAELPWEAEAITDGTSSIKLQPDNSTLKYDYQLSANKESFAGANIAFVTNQGKPWVDLSNYKHVSLRAKCVSPAVITFAFQSIGATSQAKLDGFPSTEFSCGKSWRRHSFDIELIYASALKHSNPRAPLPLSRITGVSFVSDAGSSAIASTVELSDLVLYGRNNNYFYAAIFVTLLAWSAFITWVITARKTLPLQSLASTNHVYAQQEAGLAKEPKDKAGRDEKIESPTLAVSQDNSEHALGKMVADYLRQEFRDPSIHLEGVCEKLTINRTKMNRLLKEEVGLTFKSYLNHLRMSEAEQILKENQKMSVSQVANWVGFNNVSYFCKVFKSQYGCTPKEFKTAEIEERVE